MPFLPTVNIQETNHLYQNQLGFGDVWIWDEPPNVIRLGRDPIKFHFNLQPDYPVLQKGFDLMVFMSGIQVLYDEFKGRTLLISDPLELKPWGIWEFTLRDHKGYFLRVCLERLVA